MGQKIYMKPYELIFITASGEEKEEKKIQTYIKDLSGVVEKKESWGKKTFSYPIKKKRSGYYFEYQINLAAPQVLELKRKLDLDESILRYLLLT